MEIKALYTYPIKSLGGCSVPAISFTYRGPSYDRTFMLFRPSDQKTMHVAYQPELCLFTTEIVFTDDNVSGKIIVTFNPPTPNEFSPSQTSPSSLEVPLVPSINGLDEVEVNMHSSPTIGYSMGSKNNDWFSERLGYDVLLLYLGNNRRKVLGNLPPNVAAGEQRGIAQRVGGGNGTAPKGWLSSITSVASSIPVIGSTIAQQIEGYGGVDEGIGFADCAPYLVVSAKSWENAQSRLQKGEVLDIVKFRPNIIVEGADEAFEEDYWAELELIPVESKTADVQDQEHGGGQSKRITARMILTQNCARCNSLNVDYRTGKVGVGDAGKILKKLQSDRRVDPGMKYSPIFGRYGFLDRIEGGQGSKLEVRVGDEVRVAKRNGIRTVFEWPGISTN